MGLITLILISTILSPEAHAALPSRRVCTSTSSSTTLSLDCPVGHVIHVQHWLTSLGHKGDIGECIVNSDCSLLRDSDKNGLLTGCNGLQRCNDTVTVSAGGMCPNGTMPRYFQVQYECIPDNSTITLCNDDTVTGNSTSLYIKTPAFPDRSDVRNRTCTCQVQGQGLSVTLLELLFPENLASLSISNSTAELWRYSLQSAALFNRQVVAPGPQDFLNISFHDHGAQRQRAWLEVSANSGPLSIGCGASASMTSFSQSVTTTTAATSVSSSTGVSPGPSGTGSPETGSTETSSGSSTGATASTSPAETNPSISSSSTTDLQDNTTAVSVNSPATTSSMQVIGSLQTAVPAAVGGVVLIAVVVGVVVFCRRRRARRKRRRRKREEDDLEQVPEPAEDLHNVSRKSPSSPPPSAASVFQGQQQQQQQQQQHYSLDPSPTACPEKGSVSPAQVHLNPAFSPELSAEDRYVSSGSLASNVYQEISDLDLAPDGGKRNSRGLHGKPGRQPINFIYMKPTPAGSNDKKRGTLTEPDHAYLEVLADADTDEDGVGSGEKRDESQDFQEAQPYAVRAVEECLAGRKTTGDKVEVVPFKPSIPAQSEATGHRSAERRREAFDPSTGYEAVDIDDNGPTCTTTPAARATDAKTINLSAENHADLNPCDGHSLVNFSGQDSAMATNPTALSSKTSEGVNNNANQELEDGPPLTKPAGIAEDSSDYNVLFQSAKTPANASTNVVYNTLHDSFEGLENASMDNVNKAEKGDSSEGTKKKDGAEEPGDVDGKFSACQNDEQAPMQARVSEEEDCLVDNILYESFQNIQGHSI